MNCSLLENTKSRIADEITRLDRSAATAIGGEVAETKVARVTVEIDHIDLLQWLAAQRSSTKIYWADRHQEFEVAGVGVADSIVAESANDLGTAFADLNLRLHRSADDLRYFGGMPFSPIDLNRSGSLWGKLGKPIFILPEIEVSNGPGKRSFLTCNLVVRDGESASNRLKRTLHCIESCDFDSNCPLPDMPQVIARDDVPDRAGWDSLINSCIGRVDRGEPEKIVMARRSRFKFDRDINPFAALGRIQRSANHCYQYCFQLEDNIAFVGASPERLFKRSHDQIHVEAIAGTRDRGETPSADAEIGAELMASEKDLREHQYVVRHLKEALSELGCTIKSEGKVCLLKLASLQHLCVKMTASLPADKTDADIIAALHPTSAVGGFPAQQALECIQALESFDRGWYAAPLGWIQRNSAEFAVGIRSSLIHDHEMYAFAGAGIVRGSRAEKEWCEVEKKLTAISGGYANSVTPRS